MAAKKIIVSVLAVLCLAIAWAYGIAVGAYRIWPAGMLRTVKHSVPVDDAAPGAWPAEFRVVNIRSSKDGHEQKAYFLPAKAANAPLVVSLHSWSGTYAQEDGLAKMVQAEGWAYIHPDFRGANWSPAACLGDAVVSDIDDAMRYAIKEGGADPARVVVVGGSGGAYAALGSYLRSQVPVLAYMVWNPITDLAAWYRQSMAMRQKYADDIVRCTGETLDVEAMRARSPLLWKASGQKAARLEIYAGLHDGHHGMVPISHSLLFFNRVAATVSGQQSMIGADDMLRLVTRDVDPSSKNIEGRVVYFSRDLGRVALTIFDGDHEMLRAHAMQRLRVTLNHSAQP